ncbi:MAG: acetylglutamate kinase, partial [Prevotellaceae bacterium]|nr:acetylglutamate kinase [Prevotellaceae bacterium]
MELTIIKIGGNVIDDAQALSRFLDFFSRYPGLKILVHGGGGMATQMAKELGIPTQMHEGRRITSPEMLKIAVMVYAGWINKQIVAGLQQRNCPAIGLSGADANLIPAHKRPVTDIDYGEVGDISPDKVNTGIISMLLFKELVPVVCSITHDQKGHLLNTNADTITSTLAVALSPFYPTRLIYCFEQKG